VLGSFLVSLSSQLTTSSLTLYQDLLVCVKVIPQISLFVTPAIALYKVLSFSIVYSIIFVVVPPLGKYKYDNPNTTR
jgi:hypothetical protein